MARKIKKLHSLLLPGVIGVGSWFGMIGQASAATEGPITTTTPIINQLTDWTGNTTFLRFPQFNPSLGTLTSVSLSLTGNITSTLTVTNLGNSTSNGNDSTTCMLSITDASGVITGLAPQITIPTTLWAYGPLAADGGNATSIPALTGNGSYTNSFGNASVLAEFTGTGNISLPAGTYTFTTLQNHGGNSLDAQVTDATLTGNVTYTYTAVPEPTSVTLLVLGGAVALMQRRRRPQGLDAKSLITSTT